MLTGGVEGFSAGAVGVEECPDAELSAAIAQLKLRREELRLVRDGSGGSELACWPWLALVPCHLEYQAIFLPELTY